MSDRVPIGLALMDRRIQRPTPSQTVSATFWTTLAAEALEPIGTAKFALMLSGAQTTGLSVDEMKHGLVTYYGNTPGRPAGIPVWEFRW